MARSATSPEAFPRIHSLDGVRAIAMLLGLPMHAALTFYTPWSGIVDRSATPLAGEVLSSFFGFFHHFRMQLFFLVAGFFAHLLCNRGVGYYLKNRLVRVGVPLVFGVLVALPLVEVMIRFGQARSRYQASGIPWKLTWEHIVSLEYWRDLQPHYLWFLLYLMIFYPSFAAFHRLFQVNRNGYGNIVFKRGFGRLCRSYWVSFVMVVPIVCAKILTDGPLFTKESMTLPPALINLMAFGFFFAFGWLLFGQPELLSEFAKRWKFHAVTGGYLWLGTKLWPNLQHPISQAFLAWSLSFALLGVMVKHLGGHSPIIRYLADSSYWLYLAHVPLLMFLQINWAYWTLPWWLKFPILNCVLIILLLLSYDLLVRGTWIGVVLNGKRQPSLIKGFRGLERT